MSKSVVVRVPGSTSNCGPGFDTLGLALSLYGSVTVSGRDDDKIVYSGNQPNFPEAAVAMAEQVAKDFFQKTGQCEFGFEFDIVSDVPVARGLGSSVILRGGILAGLNRLVGSPLSKDEQIERISAIEGHPDNASAAILGGFTVARFCPEKNKYLGTQSFAIPPTLSFVVVSPDLEIKTDASRHALPKEIEFSKVISSLNSLAFLVAAFVSGSYDALNVCRVDHLHEPYRLKTIPQGKECIEAGIQAGAYTGWLSGSGSSVLCVVKQERAERVKTAMETEFKSSGLDFRSYILQADNAGLTIEN